MGSSSEQSFSDYTADIYRVDLTIEAQRLIEAVVSTTLLYIRGMTQFYNFRFLLNWPQSIEHIVLFVIHMPITRLSVSTADVDSRGFIQV